MTYFDNDPLLHFSLGTEAVYSIIVYGRLDQRWSAQLGLQVDYSTLANNVTLSTLSGSFQDQAALFGVLNGLYGLGFPLLEVTCFSASPTKQT
jgi:hypothetical protein